jgi:hypothetical protein
MDVLFNLCIDTTYLYVFKVLEGNAHNALLKFMGVNVILWKAVWAIL